MFIVIHLTYCALLMFSILWAGFIDKSMRVGFCGTYLLLDFFHVARVRSKGGGNLTVEDQEYLNGLYFLVIPLLMGCMLRGASQQGIKIQLCT